MSGGDPQDLIQWQEAQRWLAKAAEDIAVVRVVPSAAEVSEALSAVEVLMSQVAAEVRSRLGA